MKEHTGKILLLALALVGLTAVCDLRFSLAPSQAQTDNATPIQTAAMVCPKCKSDMQAGIMGDYWNINRSQAWWPAHEKQHLFSSGTRIKITVYRCSNCGYLESYAK